MSHKILYTSDLHGNKDFYNLLIKKAKEKEIKGVIIGGDLGPRGGDTIEEWVEVQRFFFEDFFIPKLSALKKNVFFTMGNDDLRKNEELFLNLNHTHLKYIHKKRESLLGMSIVGYSIINPTPFRLKDWEKPENKQDKGPNQMFDHEIRTVEKEEGTIEEDLKELKKLANPKSTLYVMHAPPFGTKLDVIINGEHVGCKATRSFIEKEQPKITLHGHIHESPQMSGSFIDTIGNTPCINVGSSYPDLKLNAAIIDLTNFDLKYIEIA